MTLLDKKEFIDAAKGTIRQMREIGMTDVAIRVVTERYRQVYAEGHETEHDDSRAQGELALGAACYAAPEPHYSGLGFEAAWPARLGECKREKHTRARQLEIAGALILAELERLLRQETGKGATHDPPG